MSKTNQYDQEDIYIYIYFFFFVCEWVGGSTCCVKYIQDNKGPSLPKKLVG